MRRSFFKRNLCLVMLATSGVVCPVVLAQVQTKSVQSKSVQPKSVQPTKAQSEKLPDAPFINTWLVAGAFENDAKNSGYNQDWIGEVSVKPKLGLVSGGKTWRYFDDRLFSRNYDDYQDFFSYFKTKRGESVAAKVAYAHVYIFSAKMQKVQLRIGADNEYKSWLNGALVGESTEGHWKRDTVKHDVVLVAGWNRLLLKIANQEEGRFGFYARLSDEKGAMLPGLTYSTSDQGAGKLAVATQAMTDIKSGVLPIGYREWSYVGANPPYEAIEQLGKIEDTNLETFVTDRSHGPQASDFALLAQGGLPPYHWSIGQGQLPPGLTLGANGVVSGTVAFKTALRSYPFTVQVIDKKGAIATSRLAITVKERPNKWYEEARLSALIHGPNALPVEEIDDLVRMMKRQGYQVGMPISYNNGGLFTFLYPSRLGVPEKLPAIDWVNLYKNALEKEGMQFGMYFGNVDYPGDPNVSPNRGILLLEEALHKYHPRVYWFDWGSINSVSLDALYSMIKTADPEAVVLLNGVSNGTQGDWDEICFEGITVGDAGWQYWPTYIPWFKKHASESWRFIPDPVDPDTKGIEPDWQDTARMLISMIGEGFVANIDHSPYNKGATKTIYDLARIQIHQKIADWASPKGLPPLYPSYTQVNMGPLPAANWGYNTINLKRDTIYLHVLKNPRGKVGMPASKVLNLAPIGAKVQSVTWMNANKPVPFSSVKAGNKFAVKLNLHSIQVDPTDTILVLKLATPLPPESAPVTKYKPLNLPPRQAPAGNLASFKPAQFLGDDGKTPLLAVPSRYTSKGVDGSLQTFAFARGDWKWIYQIDLMSSYTISRVVVNFRDELFATEYNIDVSEDGTNWNTVAHEKTDRGGEHVSTFKPSAARYVRIHELKPDGLNADGSYQPGTLMGIREFQVFEK